MPTPLRLLAGFFLASTLTLGTAANADLGSQFIDPLDGKLDLSEYLAENAFGFLPIPIIITEPAVEGGLGLAGLFFHEDEEAAASRKDAMQAGGDRDAARHLLPPNISVLAGAYTGNGSSFLGGGHMGFFNEGKIRYSGGLGYADFKLDYYSIGDTELAKPISLTTEAGGVFQSLKFKIGDLPLYIGPMQRFITAELAPSRSVGELLPPDFPPDIVDKIDNFLSTEIVTSGLGIEFELDMRDNIFTPTDGIYYDFSYVAYRDALGSDVDYDWYSLTGLNYYRFSPHLRVGLRLVGELVDTSDPLPPFALPALDLRGVPAARYQGTHMGLVETEVTWDIDRRWSVLGFVGGGRVANNSSDFSSAQTQVNKGLGFRYQIARRYGFHVGVDVAQGPEDTVWYIQAGSAW